MTYWLYLNLDKGSCQFEINFWRFLYTCLHTSMFFMSKMYQNDFMIFCLYIYISSYQILSKFHHDFLSILLFIHKGWSCQILSKHFYKLNLQISFSFFFCQNHWNWIMLVDMSVNFGYIILSLMSKCRKLHVY